MLYISRTILYTLILSAVLAVSLVAHGQTTPTAGQMAEMEELQRAYESATSEAEIRILDQRMHTLFDQIYGMVSIPQTMSEIEAIMSQQSSIASQSPFSLTELQELQHAYESATSETEIQALDEHIDALLESTLNGAPSESETREVERQLQGLQQTLGVTLNDSFSPQPTTQNVRESVARTADGNDFPLDLIWTAHTLVPSEYAGKPRAVSGSTIVISALTPTQSVSDIEFRWIVEDSTPTVRGALNTTGIGEHTYSLTGHQTLSGFTHRMRVEATNVRTGAQAQARISIPLARPEVHLYTAPYGMWASRISNQFFIRAGGEGELYARPFYFSTQHLEELAFEWEFDRERISTRAHPDRFTLSVSSRSAPGTTRPLRVSVLHENPLRRLIDRAAVSVRMEIIE